MYRSLIVGLVLLGGSLAFGGGAQDASQALVESYPQVQFFSDGGRLAQVYGTSFSYGLSAEQSADTFVRNYGDLFGVRPDELQPGNAVDAVYALPLLYDESTDTYKATMVCYRQYQDGIPVYGADLRLLVANTPAYPLVLANSTLCDLGDFAVAWDTVADIADGAAYSAAAAFRPGLNDFSVSDLVIWPDLGHKPSRPSLALTFVGTGLSPNAEPLKWRFVCDAATGAILHAEDLILFTDVTGTVTALSTTPPKAEQCSAEVSMAMPYATVSISGGSSVYANASGNFTIPNGGTSAVTVLSPMGGRYFNVTTASGSLDSLSMSVTPPGPANFVHNSANSSESIRAQVNAYVQSNRVRDWVLVQNPSYPTISTQTGFGLNVMLTGGYCPGNAWYDGSSLNFCSATSTYGDTAFASVILHEYGHHLVATGGSGQDQYGEGAGDCVAVLLADDPQLGVGFYTSDCTNGIRTASNTMQYPCTSDIHTCAQLLSGCVWSTRNELVAGGHSDYLAVLSKLFVNSVPLHGSGGSITPAIATTFISLDNTYYGGTHVDHITTGFSAHNMMPAQAPANDACANAVVACPGTTYTGNTSGATLDGSASCGSSSSTPDVWYKYTPGASGSATFSLCGTGTTYDSVLSIHTGCPGTSSNQVACNDDSCSTQSQLTATVTGGTTYRIRISGYNGATGAYSLAITGPACGSANYTLTTAVSPSGAGTITLNPAGGSYAPGTVVTVTANAAAGWQFNNWTGDLTGSTNPTTITMNGNKSVTAVFVSTGGPTLRYQWTMDANPGWTKSPNTTANKWAWGTPTGGGGQHGSHDPTAGYTGTRVYGYNLSGDYANSIPEHHLTTAAINCTGFTQTKLRFRRWLGVEQPAYDHAYVRVSNNGSSWTTVWQNTAQVADSAWTQVEYDISAVANNKSTVYIRWTMGTTDSSWQFCGWNLDDVQIWAASALHLTDGTETEPPAGPAAPATTEPQAD